MANTTIAQYEQILKSLEQSIQEISDQYQLMQEALSRSQTHYNVALVTMKQAWSKVVNLFVKVEQLKSIRFEFDIQ